MSALSSAWSFLKQVISEFQRDDCLRMAAALAYYTVFALPPLLLIVTTLVSWFVSASQVETWVSGRAGEALGPQAAQQVMTIFTNAQERLDQGSTRRLVLSGAALIFAASGSFGALQSALNKAWQVKPVGGRTRIIRRFLLKRSISLLMVLIVALLLLVALLASSLMSALGPSLDEVFAYLRISAVGPTFFSILNVAFWLGVLTVLFAALMKVLPDARVAWRHVWLGAAVTAALFTLGNYLIGLYLGRSNPGQAFGAAAALAILLIWIYFAAVILLFGVEFTQVWTQRRGSEIRPAPGAVRTPVCE